MAIGIQQLLLVGVLVALLLVVGGGSVPATKVVFLDIGQGDSILLQDGMRQVLVDGGAGKTVLTRLSEELPYFDRSLEVVIATHPDRDHLEGLLHVLEKYPVKLVILPPIAHTSQLQDEWLRRLVAAVERKSVAYRFAGAGQKLQVGDMAITIVGPLAAEGTLAGKTNNASVLTRVDIKELSLLLTGDAEAGVERELVARNPGGTLDVDVLKAGHHGSKTSTSQELIAATSPQMVVVSAGKDNSYGHPHPTVLERVQRASSSMLRTDLAGSIRFSHDGDQW